MQVYKFGGASVKNADSVRNLEKIITELKNPGIIVVSAMGKTTNLLEKLTEAYFTSSTGVINELFNQLKTTHLNIFNDLLKQDAHKYVTQINEVFINLQNKLNTPSSLKYDFEYDQLVSFGEILSTKIIQAYLSNQGINCQWKDIRETIKTDNQHRTATVNWEVSQEGYNQNFKNQTKHIITQGFIGSTETGITTTLGREGSDYTASVLAYLSNAESVTIWKDVPGVMNADPKEFPDTQKLDVISYQEAIELAFYGAKIIHPKTIQPLKQKNIPLHVKSFLHPKQQGTIIKQVEKETRFTPVYILEKEQYLISISPRDLSFIMEKHIAEIYGIFYKHKATINLSQNSAVSYSVAASCDKRRIDELINELKQKYKVLYNQNLELLTIRNYTEKCINKLLAKKEVLLEQRSRNTAMFVTRG